MSEDALGVLAHTRVEVAGIPFAATTREHAAAALIEAAAGTRAQGVPIRLANAYCLAVASRDPLYRSVLLGPGINLPDGAPVAFVMRRKVRGRPLVRAEQVRGPSLFEAVLDRGRPAGLRHFLVGGTAEGLARLVRTAEQRLPGTAVVGTFAPPFGPFGPDEVDETVRRARATAADLVWVSLGTPKQDFAVVDLCTRLPLPVIGVGAAFDFFSGVVPEAPHLLRRSGLEWLFRLWKEPRRLWRRYLFGNLRFLGAVVRAEARPSGHRRG